MESAAAVLEPNRIYIPDLKKQQRERRMAGAAYWRGRARAPFLGALGGSGGGVAVSNGGLGLMQGLDELLAELAFTLGHLGGPLARLLPLLGKIFLVLGLATATTAAFLSARAKKAHRDLSLGVGAASVRPHPRFESVRLQFAAEAAGGLLQWAKPWNAKETPKPAAGAGTAQETPKEETKTDWANVLDAAKFDGHENKILNPNLNGANLSSTLGGSWGDKNIFADYNAAHQQGAHLRDPRILSGKGLRAAATRALTRFPSGARRAAVRGSRRVRRAFSSLAFSQLGLTRVLSGMAATTTNVETAKSLAADAFEQSATSGQTLSPISMSNVPTVVAPLGAGASDLTQPAPTPTPVNMTPYQPQLDAALQMAQQAAMLKMLGMLMLAIGAVLCAFTLTRPAGIALIALGMMMLMMSAKMGAQAKQIGDQIEKQYEQQTQKKVVDQCVDQALQGTELAQCKHDQAPSMATRIREDVEREQSATWTWDDETGQQPGGSANGR